MHSQGGGRDPDGRRARLRHRHTGTRHYSRRFRLPRSGEYPPRPPCPSLGWGSSGQSHEASRIRGRNSSCDRHPGRQAVEGLNGKQSATRWVPMDQNHQQIALFKVDGLPEGFRYQPDLISGPEEEALLAQLARQPFKEFLFQGFVGKRRVVSYGWSYDFNERALRPAQDVPDFLLPVRERAAAFAGVAAE